MISRCNNKYYIEKENCRGCGEEMFYPQKERVDEIEKGNHIRQRISVVKK